jgi:hypothetical protein
LIAKGSLILELKMPGIVPPFRFKFWMGKMVLGEREDFPRQSALKLLGIYSCMGKKKDK